MRNERPQGPARAFEAAEAAKNAAQAARDRSTRMRLDRRRRDPDDHGVDAESVLRDRLCRPDRPGAVDPGGVDT